MRVGVQLYDTQVGFLDRVVASGEHGADRESVLRALLRDHVKQRLTGEANQYVGGKAEPEVLEIPFPSYGAKRWGMTLQPVTGKAVTVRRGEVFRIEQLVGGTCVDFNAFNLNDYKEFLDCGFTRSFQSFNPGKGEFIWTNAPRGRPMFGILEIADTCELDIVGHRCNRVFDELGWGTGEHANCQDSLAEAIREYRLTPDDVHDSFNLWMATTIDETGRRRFRWNPAREGDVFDVVAMFDLVAVAVICGGGDLFGINNFTFAPIELTIFDASPDTVALVDRAEERWGRLASQVTSADLRATPINAERELRPDPAYAPAYRPAPSPSVLQVELDDTEAELVQGLVATGVYGATEAEAVRAAFMRWCNLNLNRVRRPLVRFE